MTECFECGASIPAGEEYQCDSCRELFCTACMGMVPEFLSDLMPRSCSACDVGGYGAHEADEQDDRVAFERLLDRLADDDKARAALVDIVEPALKAHHAANAYKPPQRKAALAQPKNQQAGAAADE